MSNTNEEPKALKSLDEIIGEIDLDALNTKSILADFFQTCNYMAVRAAVALRLLEKLEERDKPAPDLTGVKDD